MVVIPYAVVQQLLLLTHATVGPLQATGGGGGGSGADQAIQVAATFLGAIASIIIPIVMFTYWAAGKVSKSITRVVQENITSKLTSLTDRIDKLTETMNLRAARQDIMEGRIASLDSQFKEMGERMSLMERQLSDIQGQLPPIRQAAQRAAGNNNHKK